MLSTANRPDTAFNDLNSNLQFSPRFNPVKSGNYRKENLKINLALEFLDKYLSRESLTNFIFEIKQILNAGKNNLNQSLTGTLSEACAVMSLHRKGREILSGVLEEFGKLQKINLSDVRLNLTPGIESSSKILLPSDPEKSTVPEIISSLPVSAFLYLFSSALRGAELSESVQEVCQNLEEKAGSKKLKLMTWNVAGLPPYMQFDFRESLDFLKGKVPERYKQIGLAIRASEADIFAGQEFFDKSTLKIADQSGFQFRAYAPNMYGSLGVLDANGLIILSKHRILQSFAREFSDTFGIESYSKKGALFAQLQLPAGDKIWVVNTHTISTSALIEEEYAKPVRARQFEELNSWIDKLGENAKVIVMGDFNSNLETDHQAGNLGTDLYRLRYPGSANQQSRIHKGYTFDTVENPRARNFVLSEKDKSPKRIDGIFTRGLTSEWKNSVAAELGNGDQSDHYSVSATIMSF